MRSSEAEHDRNAGRLAVAVLLIAGTLLSFELISTRLFSVILWNHFAFLAISIALFGLGGGGMVLYALPGRFTRERAWDQIRFCALALPVVLWIAVVVLCALPIRMDFGSSMVIYLAIIFAVTALPFAVGGAAIALALTHWPDRVNRIYAFDLIGSALGCALVIVLLGTLDGPTAALALAVLPLAAAWLMKPSRPVALAVLLALAAVAVNQQEDWVRIQYARSKSKQALFEKWNAFSRVTVVESDHWRGWWVSPDRTEPQVETLGIEIDADAFTPLMRFDGDLNKVRVVLADLTSAAYNLSPNADSVLVIGAGGGRDVLAALASGAGHVTAVELNPLIARDVVSGKFRDFTGDPYSHPRVELIVGEGRTVVDQRNDRYDIIQLSMVDTSAASAAGAYALTENSLYTLEAAEEFLAHLEPGGLLTTTWANFPNLEGVNRLVALYAAALRGDDPTSVADRIAVIAGPTPHRLIMPLATVIVRPSGFTDADAARLHAICDEYGFLPLHVPGDPLDGPVVRKEQEVIRRILAGEDLDRFYREYRLDLTPVTDDRPFFFYQNRLEDAWGALTTWRQGLLFGNGLFILVKLLVLSAVAVTAFIGMPLLFARRDSLHDLRGSGPFAIYFLCLGVGFITIEIALVQMFGYFLGQPLLGLGVCLTSILAFTGIGSAIGSRWDEREVQAQLPKVLALVVALGVVYASVLPAVVAASRGNDVWIRSLLVALLIGPLGIVLGMPFPGGLRLIRSELSPWMWAINAGASVFGATLATMIVMHVGFSRTLIVGAAIYALAIPFLRRATSGRSSA